jgi:chromosome segregation ATPase
MLRENGCELLKNSKMLNHSRLATNEKAQMVLERLNKAQESDTIEWTSFLNDETDQRHILGNLQNRMHMGRFSLSKCFEKIRKDAEAEMRRYQEGHKREIDEKTNRIWEWEKLLTDSIGLNRRYEERMTIMRSRHENAEKILEVIRGTLRKLRKECHNNNDTTTKLHGDFSRLRSVTERLLRELGTTKETIQVLTATIHEKQEDIDARDVAMQQLEKLLQNITHRYAENERLRIKVTLDAAVQAVSTTKEESCVADFLQVPLRTVVDEEDKSKSSSDALLPGRIIQIQNDENWPLGKYPSRVNVGPPSALGYRKIIDRL